MKRELSVGEAASVVVSGTTGMIVGIKAGIAVGSLFGPFGLAICPLVGAVYGQWTFMQRTIASETPLKQAATDAARLAVTGFAQTQAPPTDHNCPSAGKHHG